MRGRSTEGLSAEPRGRREDKRGCAEESCQLSKRAREKRIERSKSMLLDAIGMLILLQQELKFVGVGVAAGAGTGYLIGQTIASIHRQPEAFEQTRTLMFLGIGLVEAFALYSLVFALLIAFVL